MHKIKFIFLFSLTCYSSLSNANNSIYITLSNQNIKMEQLSVVSNNAANSNTVGYEEDRMLIKKFNVKENKFKTNSFSTPEMLYKSERQGGLKKTGNIFDLAIIGDKQYFKILTPNGFRYSLSGSFLKNVQNQIVTSEGYNLLTIDNAVIELPEDGQEIFIAENGTIFVDNEEIARIGVFQIEDKNKLKKIGDALYESPEGDNIIEEYTVLSGYLRTSNVNSAKIMADLIEIQRSFTSSSELMKELNDLEKNAISRLVK